MSKVLIGSYALSQYFPDEVTPNDRDFFISEPDEKVCEKLCKTALKTESFYHPELFKWEWKDIATIDELYTIKVSHSFWALKNNSWKKHMYYILFLQSKGAKLIPELYETLYSIWEDTYGKKKANLESSPEEFFNKHVQRKYDHDSIHASVAYFEEPLFNKILRDNSEVAVSKKKFDNLSYDMKLKLVREEVYATALERRGVPSDYKENYRKAYDYALCQTITSFTKGWFPLFIVDNYQELFKPDHNFYQTHLNNSDKLIKIEE